ncbi:Na+/H+ antiporter NhaC family protein [Pseudomonas sp. NPDC087346]|uniref:Na+/H+ antiporter NhaC family protein n=1 Tax=Pseudomonas sp. NPDC087346 TaxID=3364438 RepID=UPI0038255474
MDKICADPLVRKFFGFRIRSSFFYTVVVVFSLALCALVGMKGGGNTVWGLVPILLYAGLCIAGLDIVLATAVALAAAFAILQPQPIDIGVMLGSSLSNNVTIIGLITLMGAGLGEVLKTTGVAHTIVKVVLNGIGIRSERAAIVSIMLSSMLIVFMLGTIGGALAVAGPILIAFATQYSITRRATAVAFLYGGCAGLALAPFAGSNIAIMQAAKVSYLQYLTYGAGPLAILSFLVGVPVLLRLQKRAVVERDFYPAIESDDEGEFSRGKFATVVFSVTLLLTIGYAAYTRAGTTLPLLTLPLMAVVTGCAAGLSPKKIIESFYRGAGGLIHIFILFWMLATLFNVIDDLGPFKSLVESYHSELLGIPPYLFVLIVSMIGLIAVPGASAAVVVLVDKLFGGLADQMGITSAAWIIVLIFSSKGDTYGPFPNPNMVTCMGMARYENLRYMLLSGWVLLVPCTLMFAVLLYFV